MSATMLTATAARTERFETAKRTAWLFGGIDGALTNAGLRRGEQLIIESTLDLESLRGQLVSLCRTVAPDELDGVPVYVIWESELGWQATCGGITSQWLHAVVAEHDLPQYEGPGVGMMLSDRVKVETINGYVREYQSEFGHAPSTAALFTRSAIQTCVHELAHIVSNDQMFLTAADVTTAAAGIMKSAQDGIHKTPLTERTDRAPFHNHAWRFVRTAAHCCHRASLHGIDVEPDRIFASARYGLSDASQYVATLDRELSDCEGMPFAEIRHRKLPKAFAELWRSDFRRWFDSADLQQLADSNFSRYLIDESIIEGVNSCQ